MSYWQVVEAGGCRLISFLPYLVLVLFPFRDHFRFSLGTTLCMAGGLTAFELIISCLSQCTGAKGIGTALHVLSYATMFSFSVKTSVGKILFTLFMTLNYAAMMTVTAIFTGYLWQGQVLSINSFMGIIPLSILLLFTAPFMWRYIDKNIRPMINSADTEITRAWHSLWLIPTVFYVIYYYSFYADWTNAHSLSAFAIKPGNVAFIILLNGGSFLMYRIVFNYLSESVKNQKLLQENSQLAIITRQYKNLQEKIDVTLKARHDLRHHLTVIDLFLKEDDISGLKGYLKEYRAALPDLEGLPLCDNQIINGVAGYYLELSKSQGIETNFRVNLSPKLPISDSDFASILGNLLENALEACRSMKSAKRFIHLNMYMETEHMLILVVENTYENGIRRANKTFLSSKHEGNGIGITSVCSLVEKNGGVIRIQFEDGIFCVHILLYGRNI